MDLADLISRLPAAEQEQLLEQVGQYKDALVRERAQKSFMSFTKEMWPGFIHGRHHAVMAKKFEEIAQGKLKRLIINMPPRHTKSEFASYLLPAWFLGNNPEKKVIQTSNTAELAVGFGRKVRNLVDSDQYGKIFPGVGLRVDSKAAGRWATSHGGDYFAIGVGGTVTGKGADLLIIDDLGIKPLEGELVQDIYDLLEERYLKRSTIITSQLLVANWKEVITDAVVFEAIVDRIAHGYKIEITGDSYRKKRGIDKVKGTSGN
jgi:hypothetical protein